MDTARVSLMGHICGADDQEAAAEPGNDEDDPLLLVLQRIGVGLQRLTHLDDGAASARKAQRAGRRGCRCQSLDLSDPWAARVDDEARLDGALCPVLVELDCIPISERRNGCDGAPV